jgi:tetratricopeptide (TPR) repeat protein
LQAIPGLEPAAEPDTLITALLKRGRWLEALELAVRHLPERVPEVLEAAGEAPWTQGLQGRLYPLLSALPEDVKQQGTVLGWRLLSALALGKEREVVPEVERLLARDEAPEIRALYAEALFAQGDLEASLQESMRAAKASESPLTLYAYGQALGLQDPHEGQEQLERALRLAESRGERTFAAQVAEALAARATTLGRYRRAADWAAWGLKLYYRQGMGQALLWLALINESAFARLLSGEAVGLAETLRHESGSLEGVYPSLARLLRTTLADLLLIEGNVEASLSLYREFWLDNEKRETVGALANLYVRALLEAGEADEALRVGAQAVELSRGLHLVNTRRAGLALGMALSETDPDRATLVLEQALHEFQQPLFAPRLAQASLYLARAQVRLGHPNRALAALEAGRAGLQELGREGLHYLAGPPEAFQEVFGLLTGEQAALELHFLGAATARLGGKTTGLSQRFADLIAVLALHPEGMSGERLTLSVYGEFGNAKVCKAELARLRKKVPLENRPYRLGTAVTADFLELDALLRDGRLMQALALYRGPLLPKSEAPEVVAAREQLDETLRQAVLASGNQEALWALAERWPEDLELQEVLIASLDKGDPRRASALARVKGLERTWGL